MLEELYLGDRWGDRSDELSGGTQQRLQLATALVHAPEVIVLDEPFSGRLHGRRLRHHQRQREHTPC